MLDIKLKFDNNNNKTVLFVNIKRAIAENVMISNSLIISSNSSSIRPLVLNSILALLVFLRELATK